MSDKKKKKAVKPTSVKPKQTKKTRKPMDPHTKEALKTSFSTLINNDACVKISREYKGAKWAALAVGLALASIIIADVPSLVNRLNVNYGDSVLGSPNYSLDTELTDFSQALAANGVELSIKDGKPLTKNWKNICFPTEDPTKTYTWYADYSTSMDKTMFEAFVNDPDVLGNNVEDSVFFARIQAGQYPENGTTRPDHASTTYTTNFIAFGQSSFMIGRYDSTGSGSTLSGNNSDIEGTVFNVFATEKTDDMGKPVVGEALKDHVVERYKAVIVAGTNRSKYTSGWSYAGIVFGVYAGLEILFGLVLFLLTRGKRNPFRIYTFWECQKMSYWAGLAPALISLVVGFVFSSYALLAFIFIFGMRLMWMSMKSMRPAA